MHSCAFKSVRSCLSSPVSRHLRSPTPLLLATPGEGTSFEILAFKIRHVGSFRAHGLVGRRAASRDPAVPDASFFLPFLFSSLRLRFPFRTLDSANVASLVPRRYFIASYYAPAAPFARRALCRHKNSRSPEKNGCRFVRCPADASRRPSPYRDGGDLRSLFRAYAATANWRAPVYFAGILIYRPWSAVRAPLFFYNATFAEICIVKTRGDTARCIRVSMATLCFGSLFQIFLPRRDLHIALQIPGSFAGIY